MKTNRGLVAMAELLVSPEREWDAAKQLAHGYINERRAIAKVLADFYRAPLTMASVQPILDLAVELNPELKDKS